MITPLSGRLLPAWLLASMVVTLAHADVTVNFSTADAGVKKSIPNWGLDTNWASADNMRRGLFFMGTENVNVVRVPGMVDKPVDNGLTAEQKAHLQDCINIASMASPTAKWDMCAPGSDSVNAWYQTGVGTVSVDRWAQALKLCQQFYNHAFWMVEPFNEPDYATWGEGTKQNLYDIIGALQNSAEFKGAMMAGGSTMSVDQAASWYDAVRTRAEVGTTHCLYGTVANYADFIQRVTAAKGLPINPEGHNVVEAIIGAEYGLQGMIWWGTAELARGEFVRASQGVRLGYAEDRGTWTAAAVYRAPSGAVQAFLGGSERVGGTMTYTFHATDRDVYYDGHGPQRDYTVTIKADQERVINITWGSDAPVATNGRFAIINTSTGLCMEIAGASKNAGAALQLNTYSKATHQLWDITPLATSNIGDLSHYLISNVNSALYVDLPEWIIDDERVIKQYNYPANTVEHWYFEYVGQGNYRIRSRWSGKCLSVALGANGVGATVVQRAYNGAADQLWRVQSPDAPVSQTPVISKQPQSTVAAAGRSLTLSVEASGASALSYQWLFNGAPIAGATQATYTVNNVSNSDAGAYSVVVTNSFGSVTSSTATVTVANASDIGHIVNLSARAVAGSGNETLIVGLVVRGGAGAKPLLARGVGPSLSIFSVPGYLTDPKLTVYSGSTAIFTNDNWAGDAQVAALIPQVGAFSFTSSTSLDAASVLNIEPGAYTIHVTSGPSAPNGTGVALAEFYDASPVYTADTPRLVNISARSQVGVGGDVLIIGFVIGGSTPVRVLVRGVGPGLAQFNVGGLLANPKMILRKLSGELVQENDDWGQAPNASEIPSVMTSVNAFGLTTGSKDSIILTTLQPGAYTAVISGVNDTTGVALAEVYEVQ